MEWYYASQGQQHGPVSKERLVAFILGFIVQAALVVIVVSAEMAE